MSLFHKLLDGREFLNYTGGSIDRPLFRQEQILFNVFVGSGQEKGKKYFKSDFWCNKN